MTSNVNKAHKSLDMKQKEKCGLNKIVYNYEPEVEPVKDCKSEKIEKAKLVKQAAEACKAGKRTSSKSIMSEVPELMAINQEPDVDLVPHCRKKGKKP